VQEGTDRFNNNGLTKNMKSIFIFLFTVGIPPKFTSLTSCPETRTVSSANPPPHAPSPSHLNASPDTHSAFHTAANPELPAHWDFPFLQN
jgi:hypothetical protein